MRVTLFFLTSNELCLGERVMDPTATVGRPLAPKPEKTSDDSGLASGSNQNVSPTDENDTMLFNKLAKVNQLIDQGDLREAHRQLLLVKDCPPRLLELYVQILASYGYAIESEKIKSLDSNEKEMSELASWMDKLRPPSRPAQAERPNTTSNSTKILQSLLDKAKKRLDGLFRKTEDEKVTCDGEQPIVNQSNRVKDTVAPQAPAPLQIHSSLTLQTPMTFHPLCTFPQPTPPRLNNTDTPIRFMTYNLCLKPPGVRTSPQTKMYKDLRLDHFIAHVLPYYDVVALQEVFAFGSYRRDKLLKKAKELGFMYWICSSTKDERPGAPVLGTKKKVLVDGGLALLSRYPIVGRARMNFDYGVGADRYDDSYRQLNNLYYTMLIFSWRDKSNQL